MHWNCGMDYRMDYGISKATCKLQWIHSNKGTLLAEWKDTVAARTQCAIAWV